MIWFLLSFWADSSISIIILAKLRYREVLWSGKLGNNVIGKIQVWWVLKVIFVCIVAAAKDWRCQTGDNTVATCRRLAWFLSQWLCHSMSGLATKCVPKNASLYKRKKLLFISYFQIPLYIALHLNNIWSSSPPQYNERLQQNSEKVSNTTTTKDVIQVTVL